MGTILEVSYLLFDVPTVPSPTRSAGSVDPDRVRRNGDRVRDAGSADSFGSQLSRRSSTCRRRSSAVRTWPGPPMRWVRMPPCDPARHRRHGRARRDGSGDRARRLMLRRGRECGDAAMMLVRFGVRLRPRSRIAHSTRSTPVVRRAMAYARSCTSDERAPPRKAVRACTRTVNEGGATGARLPREGGTEPRFRPRGRPGRRPTAAPPATRIRATVPPPRVPPRAHHAVARRPTGENLHNHEIARNTSFPVCLGCLYPRCPRANPPERFSSVRPG